METCTEFRSKDYHSKCILLMEHHTLGDLATAGSNIQLNGLPKGNLCHQGLKILTFVEKLGGIKKQCKMEKPFFPSTSVL